MVKDLTLISQEWTTDSIGQRIAAETERNVLATIRSVGRNEWVSAGQNSIRADIVAVIPIVDYSNERICIIDGVRRSIYRTYMVEEDDEIELYIEEEAGTL